MLLLIYIISEKDNLKTLSPWFGGNKHARKQWSGWLNEEILSCCTQFSTIVRQITWNFHNLRFNDNENTTLNISFRFSIFTSTALLPVHLQPALSTIKDAMKKQWITKYSPFPKCLFLRDVSVAVVSSKASLTLVFKLSYSLFISFQEKITGKSVAQIWPCSFSLRYYLHFKYHSCQIVANQIGLRSAFYWSAI